jgi:hypothetical protein
MKTITKEQFTNDIKNAVSYNKQEGKYLLTRKKFPSYCKILSKHGNRAIVQVNNVVYRVKFRDFSATPKPEPRFENDLTIDYSLQFIIDELPAKEIKKSISSIKAE